MSAKKIQRASIHDVARLAGVSAATVSKVLRGVKTVKVGNVEKIQQAVKELNYRLDPLASDLRRSERRIIGLVVPDLENEFFGKLTSTLEILAENAGYTLTITSSQESEVREKHLIERLCDWRVAGTILAPVRSERGEGAMAMKENAMVGVLVDRVTANQHFDTVTSDNALASAKVAKSLINAGHRHILLLGLSEVSKNVRTRISAFKEEVASTSLNIRVDVLPADGSLEDLENSVSEYLDKQKPTAVFSLFQKGTLAVLAEFRRRNIKCPEQISLVGFDDAEWMQATYPAVSAVVQPIKQIAEQAFIRLLLRIEGNDDVVIGQLEHCDYQQRESVMHVGPVPVDEVREKPR